MRGNSQLVAVRDVASRRLLAPAGEWREDEQDALLLAPKAAREWLARFSCGGHALHSIDAPDVLPCTAA